MPVAKDTIYYAINSSADQRLYNSVSESSGTPVIPIQTGIEKNLCEEIGFELDYRTMASRHIQNNARYSLHLKQIPLLTKGASKRGFGTTKRKKPIIEVKEEEEKVEHIVEGSSEGDIDIEADLDDQEEQDEELCEDDDEKSKSSIIGAHSEDEENINSIKNKSDLEMSNESEIDESNNTVIDEADESDQDEEFNKLDEENENENNQQQKAINTIDKKEKISSSISKDNSENNQIKPLNNSENTIQKETQTKQKKNTPIHMPDDFAIVNNDFYRVSHIFNAPADSFRTYCISDIGIENIEHETEQKNVNTQLQDIERISPIEDSSDDLDEKEINSGLVNLGSKLSVVKTRRRKVKNTDNTDNNSTMIGNVIGRASSTPNSSKKLSKANEEKNNETEKIKSNDELIIQTIQPKKRNRRTKEQMRIDKEREEQQNMLNRSKSANISKSISNQNLLGELGKESTENYINGKDNDLVEDEKLGKKLKNIFSTCVNPALQYIYEKAKSHDLFKYESGQQYTRMFNDIQIEESSNKEFLSNETEGVIISKINEFNEMVLDDKSSTYKKRINLIDFNFRCLNTYNQIKKTYENKENIYDKMEKLRVILPNYAPGVIMDYYLKRMFSMPQIILDLQSVITGKKQKEIVDEAENSILQNIQVNYDTKRDGDIENLFPAFITEIIIPSVFLATVDNLSQITKLPFSWDYTKLKAKLYPKLIKLIKNINGIEDCVDLEEMINVEFDILKSELLQNNDDNEISNNGEEQSNENDYKNEDSKDTTEENLESKNKDENENEKQIIKSEKEEQIIKSEQEEKPKKRGRKPKLITETKQDDEVKDNERKTKKPINQQDKDGKTDDKETLDAIHKQDQNGSKKQQELIYQSQTEKIKIENIIGCDESQFEKEKNENLVKENEDNISGENDGENGLPEQKNKKRKRRRKEEIQKVKQEQARKQNKQLRAIKRAEKGDNLEKNFIYNFSNNLLGASLFGMQIDYLSSTMLSTNKKDIFVNNIIKETIPKRNEEEIKTNDLTTKNNEINNYKNLELNSIGTQNETFFTSPGYFAKLIKIISKCITNEEIFGKMINSSDASSVPLIIIYMFAEKILDTITSSAEQIIDHYLYFINNKVNEHINKESIGFKIAEAINKTSNNNDNLLNIEDFFFATKKFDEITKNAYISNVNDPNTPFSNVKRKNIEATLLSREMLVEVVGYQVLALFFENMCSRIFKIIAQKELNNPLFGTIQKKIAMYCHDLTNDTYIVDSTLISKADQEKIKKFINEICTMMLDPAMLLRPLNFDDEKNAKYLTEVAHVILYLASMISLANYKIKYIRSLKSQHNKISDIITIVYTSVFIDNKDFLGTIGIMSQLEAEELYEIEREKIEEENIDKGKYTNISSESIMEKIIEEKCYIPIPNIKTIFKSITISEEYWELLIFLNTYDASTIINNTLKEIKSIEQKIWTNNTPKRIENKKIYNNANILISKLFKPDSKENNNKIQNINLHKEAVLLALMEEESPFSTFSQSTLITFSPYNMKYINSYDNDYQKNRYASILDINHMTGIYLEILKRLEEFMDDICTYQTKDKNNKNIGKFVQSFCGIFSKNMEKFLLSKLINQYSIDSTTEHIRLLFKKSDLILKLEAISCCILYIKSFSDREEIQRIAEQNSLINETEISELKDSPITIEEKIKIIKQKYLPDIFKELNNIKNAIFNNYTILSERTILKGILVAAPTKYEDSINYFAMQEALDTIAANYPAYKHKHRKSNSIQSSYLDCILANKTRLIKTKYTCTTVDNYDINNYFTLYTKDDQEHNVTNIPISIYEEENTEMLNPNDTPKRDEIKLMSRIVTDSNLYTLRLISFQYSKNSHLFTSVYNSGLLMNQQFKFTSKERVDIIYSFLKMYFQYLMQLPQCLNSCGNSLLLNMCSNVLLCMSSDAKFGLLGTNSFKIRSLPCGLFYQRQYSTEIQNMLKSQYIYDSDEDYYTNINQSKAIIRAYELMTDLSNFTTINNEKDYNKNSTNFEKGISSMLSTLYIANTFPKVYRNIVDITNYFASNIIQQNNRTKDTEQLIKKPEFYKDMEKFISYSTLISSILYEFLTKQSETNIKISKEKWSSKSLKCVNIPLVNISELDFLRSIFKENPEKYKKEAFKLYKTTQSIENLINENVINENIYKEKTIENNIIDYYSRNLTQISAEFYNSLSENSQTTFNENIDIITYLVSSHQQLIFKAVLFSLFLTIMQKKIFDLRYQTNSVLNRNNNWKHTEQELIGEHIYLNRSNITNLPTKGSHFINSYIPNPNKPRKIIIVTFFNKRDSLRFNTIKFLKTDDSEETFYESIKNERIIEGKWTEKEEEEFSNIFSITPQYIIDFFIKFSINLKEDGIECIDATTEDGKNRLDLIYQESSENDMKIYIISDMQPIIVNKKTKTENCNHIPQCLTNFDASSIVWIFCGSYDDKDIDEYEYPAKFGAEFLLLSPDYCFELCDIRSKNLIKTEDIKSSAIINENLNNSTIEKDRNDQPQPEKSSQDISSFFKRTLSQDLSLTYVTKGYRNNFLREISDKKWKDFE